MPIISTIGRKEKKLRLLILALYVMLTIGALTMVYPFLLMTSVSFTSPVDQNEFRIIPRYFFDDVSLYRKYVEAKYGEDLTTYDAWLGTDCPAFSALDPPRSVNKAFVVEWRKFTSQLPPDNLVLAHSLTQSLVTPEMLSKYRAFLSRKFGGDLEKLNNAYDETNESWMTVQMAAEDWAQRNFMPDYGRKYRDFVQFKRSQAARYLIAVPVDGLFQEYLRLECGGLRGINKSLGSRYRTRAEIHLSSRKPALAAGDIWEAFVRKECPVQFIHFDGRADSAYRSFIKRKYGDVGAYNRSYDRKIKSFDDLELLRRVPRSGIPRADWVAFLESDVPIGAVELRTPEMLFRKCISHKFGSIERINRKLGTRFASLGEIAPPYAENDWLELKENRGAIRREFIVRNYREVIQYIALHGRSLVNTAILCFAIVFTTLTVNPLCAYALSRFNLRSTYKILLFLLATMAFPAEVSAIPSFLLIKDLHLLGTYWAVILPGIASGYSIFLLKGFFDSLPSELYEAAMLDGATEMQMYWKITLQLSKPVLAVIGLGAFTAAYGSFMWAFLVLQNPKMWTLMVWLFQMQMWAPQFLVYAGLVLAAIPTLLVFVLAQNVIMRGIIVPSEK